ncbi:Protein of unknown function (plasmid) [Azospirillum lipoferum 4B]|uniref:Uncharacterized protein n=1 Tax=Azospirillum lipoferum (strain 4B) TaxID=862719 RepID=G7ZIB3_AZOL4|nr:Protein of unknown function [Azospirillum lipoferum 4B]
MAISKTAMASTIIPTPSSMAEVSAWLSSATIPSTTVRADRPMNSRENRLSVAAASRYIPRAAVWNIVLPLPDANWSLAMTTRGTPGPPGRRRRIRRFYRGTSSGCRRIADLRVAEAGTCPRLERFDLPTIVPAIRVSERIGSPREVLSFVVETSMIRTAIAAVCAGLYLRFGRAGGLRRCRGGGTPRPRRPLGILGS